MLNKLLNNQSVIVSLDVNDFLCERIEQAISAGFNSIEIHSTDTELLTRVVQKYPQLNIGANGIINTTQLEQCYQAGVHFVSSPGFLPAIAQTAMIYSMNYIPGVATPSEAMAVMHLGINRVRPYPATLAFCVLLHQCFPSLNLYPAEIAWSDMDKFLHLAAVSAVSIRNPEKKQLMSMATDVLVTM